MTHTPHELVDEFPEYVARIQSLKQSDAHFAKLSDEYQEINRAIFRAENNLEPMEELTEVALRKERMALKDQIYRILSAPAET